MSDRSMGSPEELRGEGVRQMMVSCLHVGCLSDSSSSSSLLAVARPSRAASCSIPLLVSAVYVPELR
jgi:hypothetical protein